MREQETHPKLSVVIPAYNERATVEELPLAVLSIEDIL